MNPTKYKSIGCPEPEGGTPRSTKEIRRIRRAVKVWIAKAKGKFERSVKQLKRKVMG
tara:strand:- start:1259 stop:1429 length:171 start_codon:yes stop_codon:yes gene_type:complete